MNSLIWFLVALIGGAAMACQSPINSGLGKYVGSIESSLISFGIGFIALILVSLFFGDGDLSAIRTVSPKWLFLGGICGAITCYTIILATPHLGTGLTMTGIMLGQLVIGMLIDQFGVFQTEPVTISPLRIAGVVVIAAGILMIYWGKESVA